MALRPRFTDPLRLTAMVKQSCRWCCSCFAPTAWIFLRGKRTKVALDKIRIYPAEAISAALIAVVTAAALSLAAVGGIPIDFASFAMPYFVAFVMTSVAIGYRATGRSANISLAMASCAIFICFSNSGAMLNYALLPISRTPIDELLFRTDAAIGFD